MGVDSTEDGLSELTRPNSVTADGSTRVGGSCYCYLQISSAFHNLFLSCKSGWPVAGLEQAEMPYISGNLVS